MRVRGRRGQVLAAALLVASATVGCRRRPPPEPPVVASARPPAPDQKRPGEIAEGVEQAFGLTLPRGMQVTARMKNAVFAFGPVAPEHVANYVREHVVANHVDTGPVKTVFAGAVVNGKPGVALRIEVVARGGQSEMLVRDETRPPATQGLTEEQRWKAAGLKPDGSLLDPKHLH